MLLTNSFQVLCIWFLTQRLNRAVHFFSLWTVRRLKEDGKFNFPQRNWMERGLQLSEILFEYWKNERTFVVRHHVKLGILMFVKKEEPVQFNLFRIWLSALCRDKEINWWCSPRKDFNSLWKTLSQSRTTDAQRGNSLHCTAENSLPLPNF